MSDTPIITTVPARPPSQIILDNLTIPSQEAGIPDMGYDVAYTPYSRITTPPPLPEFTLDPETSLPTIAELAKSLESPESTSPPPLVSPPTLSTLHQSSLPLPPFPPGINHVFTPIPTVEPAVPDPRYALLDDEDPDTSGEPGIPYFLNNPTSPHFHLLMIGEPGKKEVARYIYYCKDYQEVVGTMGKGEPCYIMSVYLRTISDFSKTDDDDDDDDDEDDDDEDGGDNNNNEDGSDDDNNEDGSDGNDNDGHDNDNEDYDDFNNDYNNGRDDGKHS
ncbi:hypothetical protein EDB89DRAFT_2078445 [Lactarius sanguifluus]|nr:hypothetical protein EDB89DRAFT_2078445 [Lactarius sanguifluus]